MKRKKYIIESDQNVIIKVIGDQIANLVDGSDDYLTTTIDEKNMTISELIERLKTEKESPNTDYLFVSIGSQDFFSEIEYVNYLCDLIYEVYPNAKYYAIEGFLGEEDLIDFDEDEYDDIEQQRKLFYDEFYKNGFEIIETNLFSDDGFDINSPNILDIKKEISSLTIGDYNLIDNNTDDVSSEKKKDISSSDDETDYDTIYEFLNRFEKILKSKNVYKKGGGYNPDIHQIEIAIKFLMLGKISNFKNEGVFDNETEDAVKKYQGSKGLLTTGIADPDTIEEIFYDLKVAGFDDDDLGKYLNDKNYNGNVSVDLEDEVYLDGEVDYSGAGLSSDQSKNVQLMIDYMNDAGITNPYTQIGILSCIGKESGYMPQNETCYNTTDNSRIREVFGECRLGIYNDTELTALKKDCVKFFDAVYGPDATPCLGWDTGNVNVGDGYKYRGRGFNGITFKNTYKKYGDLIGENLVSDPDRLNDIDVAAKAAVEFFTNGRTVPEFDNKKDATDYFVNVNAGGSSGWSESFENAYSWMDKFEVIP